MERGGLARRAEEQRPEPGGLKRTAKIHRCRYLPRKRYIPLQVPIRVSRVRIDSMRGHKNGQFLPMPRSRLRVILYHRCSTTSPRRNQNVTHTEDRTEVGNRGTVRYGSAGRMDTSPFRRSADDDRTSGSAGVIGVLLGQWQGNLQGFLNPVGNYLKTNEPIMNVLMEGWNLNVYQEPELTLLNCPVGCT
jgi:hypothetical protein